MEWINIMIFIIGFFIVGLYQKKQITSLNQEIFSMKSILSTQTGLFDNFKVYFETFDPKRIQEVLTLIERKKDLEKELEIGELQSQFEKSAENLNSLETQLAEHQKTKELLIEKLEKSKSEKTDLEQKYAIVSVNIVKSIVTSNSWQIAYLLHERYTQILKTIFFYTIFGVEDKFLDAPKSREVYNELKELGDSFLSPLSKISPGLDIDLIASKELPVPEYLINLDSKRCTSELDGIWNRISPLVENVIGKKQSLES